MRCIGYTYNQWKDCLFEGSFVGYLGVVGIEDWEDIADKADLDIYHGAEVVNTF